jgi:hypothetical protein
VVGGGPAGLMAAEAAAGTGARVSLFDAMPSVGRKFLLAGRGGLNLTHSEPFDRFLTRFGDRSQELEPSLRDFGPHELRLWAEGLGVETFVGTSGRVFPKEFKAAPLLRAWVRRLKEQGVIFHPRHRWTGYSPAEGGGNGGGGGGGVAVFDVGGTAVRVETGASVLALGGGSWPGLGSTGAWVEILAAMGCRIAPLRPANCGFETAWSPHMEPHFGSPLKTIALAFGGLVRRGELVITSYGIEGSAVYALGAALRDAIESDGRALLSIDLKPDLDEAALARRLAKPRGGQSLSNWLRKTTGLLPPAVALLREALTVSGIDANAEVSPSDWAARLKAVPLPLSAPRPLAEAISSAGGLVFDEVDRSFMLSRCPGLFVAGEMLDWEAPTGGYLLTACFATGRVAGRAAGAWINRRQ